MTEGASCVASKFRRKCLVNRNVPVRFTSIVLLNWSTDISAIDCSVVSKMPWQTLGQLYQPSKYQREHPEPQTLSVTLRKIEPHPPLW